VGFDVAARGAADRVHPRTRSTFRSIESSVTVWSETGLGRWGERVEKTPLSGRSSCPLGWTFSRPRSAWCIQQITMIFPRFSRPSSAERYAGLTTISAS